MEQTLLVLNDMVRDGLIEKYAIGGALALLFYTEPAVTYDMDVFCFLPGDRGGLVTLTPLYEYLEQRGYRAQYEHVEIEGVPVQFIPAHNALVSEAIESAQERQYQAVPTRVFRPEHLLAIMVQVGRPKDLLRALQLSADVPVDAARLDDVLERHGLAEKWRSLQEPAGE